MNFFVGQLVGWRHELPGFFEMIKGHGHGPFELQGIRQERPDCLPENQTCRSACIANQCGRNGQDQHCLYLLVQTKLGLVELSANKFVSLR